jgi:pyruvate dehydrogenase E1 component
LDALHQIQSRVLWLSTNIIHHANHVRPSLDGSKVGGHQASSASVVTILTALYFYFLRAGDRVSIKPHASPAFHAIQYLLGQLPQEYLTTLRAYHGLQAYPSRTKDPDHVDFSTGSVGHGAVAPAFAALAHRYVLDHFGSATSKRFIAVVGDAELDEGNVWEAILEESLAGLDNLLWIVDLNRQSLDRVIPGIRAARLKRLFAEHGWRVLEAKYGRQLKGLFAKPNGYLLRQRIDEMSNEEYQALIRLQGAELRQRLTTFNATSSAEIATLLRDIPDAQLPGVLANLGGHDLQELLDIFCDIESSQAQPTVLFAYTIKGWGLPFAGHPLNHSALMNEEQIVALRSRLGIAPDDEWAAFPSNSPAGQLCEETAHRLYPATPPKTTLIHPDSIPQELGGANSSTTSTQESFGRLLVRLSEERDIAARVVTTSPDVAVSTNLAGWINKVGVYSHADQPDYETEALRLLKWKPGPRGQHIELGISEMNLFLCLGMFGLSHELCGQPLIPIGTVYDPFVLRGLEAMVYALYSGAKFIFAGTPSGITLSPEGGAHQSTITPTMGVELPNLNAYEPCFAREVEWILLDGLRQCLDRKNGRSTYLRLSTKLVDQTLLGPAEQRLGARELRKQVLAGGYCLLDWREAGIVFAPENIVQVVATGAMIPEAIEAVKILWNEGVAANLLAIVSSGRLFEHWQSARQTQIHNGTVNSFQPLSWLIREEEKHTPIITVHDGASHSLAWLASVHGAPLIALGVDDFGQSGSREDLYRHFGISANQIAEAAFSAVDLWGKRDESRTPFTPQTR